MDANEDIGASGACCARHGDMERAHVEGGEGWVEEAQGRSESRRQKRKQKAEAKVEGRGRSRRQRERHKAQGSNAQVTKQERREEIAVNTIDFM